MGYIDGQKAGTRIEKKARLEAALVNFERDGWSKHTEYHWYKDLKGHRLDYFPSTRTIRYQGQSIRGDVNEFISELETE